MKIYPALDLKNGQCVRLYQGDFTQVTPYEIDPLTVVSNYQDQGAEYLHIVDLDGAKQGKPMAYSLIANLIKSSKLQVQVGGGIRTRENIADYLQQGVERVIIGSLAITNPDLVRSWLQEFGANRMVLALDIKMSANNLPLVATAAWQTISTKSLWQLLDDYQAQSIQHVLCTDIDRDGTGQGPNIQLYEMIMQRYPRLQLQASGGVGSLQHLSALAASNIPAAIVGKALYENKFTLTQALTEVNTVW